MNSNCKYHDEYYDYILDGVEPDSKSKKIVFNLIQDFTDRRGLRQEFEQIDGDIQDEIIDTWINIVENELK